MMMEKEEKSDRGRSLMVKPPPPPAETAEFFLQWGSRKRLRCMRIRGGGGGGGVGGTTTTTATATSISPPHRRSSSPSPDPIPPSSNSSGRIRREITPRFPSITSAPRLTRNSEAAVTMRSEKRRISPEKEERSYPTRGSGAAAVANTKESGGGDEQLNHHHHLHQNISNVKNRGNNPVWPKLYIALSSKEKEEDFLAMKGCKLPQRPKKRAKLIQRTILLVSPGSWLPEMSLERYEVREKKTSKKQRPRGLKAMGNMESDSE